ncbi:MAG: helix-turn-helix domain-containing protein [Solirubrobacterales bacterium]
MLRERRGDTSLRRAAADAGVSFSTFSRVEAGAQPDLTSFLNLCAWLGEPPDRFFINAAARESDGVDAAISHLSSDPRLAPEASAKIAEVMRNMYEALAREVEPTPVVACHLRAATVLRPGVGERLTQMLTSMQTALEGKVDRGEL